MQGIEEEGVVVKTSASIWYVSSFLKFTTFKDFSFQLESNFAPQRERRESLTSSLTFPDLGWLVNVFLKNAGIVDHVRIV